MKTIFSNMCPIYIMKTLSPQFIAAANARRAKLSERARGREQEAVQMHEGGMSYQEIGDILAVSRQFAHVLVQRAYARKNSDKGISTGTD